MKAEVLSIILIGLLTGVFSGLFGVGGGVIIIPCLMFFYKYTPYAASGTSLVALLLPVGILGVMEYYRAGKIDMENIRVGLIIAAGLTAGTYFGAKLAVVLPTMILQRAFAVFLAFVAVRLWLSAKVP